MLRYTNYDIVFQEVPGEVTLAINISGCPNHCIGCHSSYLMEDKGDELNEDVLTGLLGKYGSAITCICFMGGDSSPADVDKLATFVKTYTERKIKTAWYSGKSRISEACCITNFDFIKLGPYIQHLGGLDSPATNQRFYRIEGEEMVDITEHFQKVCHNR